MLEPISLTGWILAMVGALLAYYYFRRGNRSHQIILEYMKAARALDDDWKRTGQRRGIVQFKEDGMPYIAWYIGSEPPPQAH